MKRKGHQRKIIFVEKEKHSGAMIPPTLITYSENPFYFSSGIFFFVIEFPFLVIYFSKPSKDLFIDFFFFFAKEFLKKIGLRKI